MTTLEKIIEKWERNRDKKEERLKWTITIASSVVLFFIQFLYFNETANRPFLSFRYINEVNVIHDNHIEIDSTGKPYEDKTRKDIMLRLEIKSTGGMPANITCTDIYLDYSGHPRKRVIRDYKNINVSPVDPVPFKHNFMILNEGLNDFTIETTFYYYGRKFLGLWYLGRPYKYYCKAKWRNRYFEILESKDER